MHFEKRENSALKHDGWAQDIDHKRPLQTMLPPESLGFRNSSKSLKNRKNVISGEMGDAVETPSEAVVQGRKFIGGSIQGLCARGEYRVENEN